MRISKIAISVVERGLKEYCQEMLQSSKSWSTKSSYIDHADCLFRFLKGEYTPGARVAPFPAQAQEAAVIPPHGSPKSILSEVEQAFGEYLQVAARNLKPKALKTYEKHTSYFFYWLKDQYALG